MNIYFLNIDLSYSRTGIENSAIFRSKLFNDKLGLNVVFITSKYNPRIRNVVKDLKDSNQISAGTKVVSLYDFYQKLDLESLPKLPLEEEFYLSKESLVLKKKRCFFYLTSNVKKVSRVEKRNKYGELESVDIYSDNIVIRRVIYVSGCFVSSVVVFDENSGKVKCEIYYRNNATVAIVKKFFLSDSIIFEVYSSEEKLVDFFKDENKLVSYFLNFYFNIFNSNKNLILIDKNRVFYDASIKLKKRFLYEGKSFFIIPAIHNLHIVNYEKKETSRVNYNYSSIFKDISVPDAIVVQTELQKKDILERFNGGNVYVIPHTYENKLSEQINIARDSYKAVYFARYSPEKKHELAIEAFAEVIKVIPTASLHCYGFGSRLSKLKKLVKELGVEKNIYLHGWCNNVAEEYESAALSIISSHSESFSLTIAESLAHGCPVVCFDVPYGPRELVNSAENGYLVQYPDTKAMAEKIILIMKQPRHQKELSINARYSSKRYSEEVVVKQWEKLFTDLRF